MAKPNFSLKRVLLATAIIAVAAHEYLAIRTFGVLIFVLVGGSLGGLVLFARFSDWRRVIRGVLGFGLAAFLSPFLWWTEALCSRSGGGENCQWMVFANIFVVWLIIAAIIRATNRADEKFRLQMFESETPTEE